MTGAAALTLAFVNVGCSSDSESVTLNKEQQYKAVFENEFGKVDPNQTWGFGEKATRSVMGQPQSVGYRMRVSERQVSELPLDS